MAFQLLVVQGKSASQAIKIGTSVMTVGRQQDCQLRIASSQVSRKHCQIFEKKGLLLVKDLGSSNGTLVNGKRIADQRVLEPGDELTVGSVKFRIERQEETVLEPGASPPASAKAADTAISQAIVGDDDFIGLAEIEETTGTNSPKSSKPVAKKATAKVAAKTQPSEEEATIEVSEDVVADYLLNIELDDEDRL